MSKILDSIVRFIILFIQKIHHFNMVVTRNLLSVCFLVRKWARANEEFDHGRHQHIQQHLLIMRDQLQFWNSTETPVCAKTGVDNCYLLFSICTFLLVRN